MIFTGQRENREESFYLNIRSGMDDLDFDPRASRKASDPGRKAVVRLRWEFSEQAALLGF